jgi:HK97 family phage major capsid protein
MNFKKLLKDKLDAQAALVNAALTAGRAMTEEETAKFNELEKEIKAIEVTIEAQNAVEARLAAENTVVNPPAAPLIQVKEKKWASFGQQLQAIKEAGTPNGRIDNRLTVGVKNATGMNEAVNSDGGFMVDEDFVGDLLKRTYDESVLASRINMIPISSKSNGLRMNGIDENSRANGSRYGGVQAYWSGEAQTVTATKPKFREISLKLEKLMALCYMTDELMEDASALEAVVRSAFTSEMAFKLDDAILSGTGAGMPLGILKSPCLVTVPKEDKQAAATVTFANVQNMWARCWGRSRINATWFISQDVEPSLNSMTLAVGTGGVPVYLPAGGVSQQPYGTLFGRPVIPIEQCSTLGATGDIILGDLSQYIGIDKGGIQAASSVHVRFLYDEQVFRFTYRVNGAPSWNTALTPYKGTNTLSPFVTLANR